MSAASLAFAACLMGQPGGGATGPVWHRPMTQETAPGGATGPVKYRPMTAEDLRAAEVAERRRRFVFSFSGGATAGLNYVPSGDLTFFFGRRTVKGRWALGYQLTLSVGGAERYGLGFFTHRHHLTGQRTFGARERGFVSVGGGLALMLMLPAVEVEGRVGVRFGERRRGVFGGLARLQYTLLFSELAPVPQLGLFLGFTTL